MHCSLARPLPICLPDTPHSFFNNSKNIHIIDLCLRCKPSYTDVVEVNAVGNVKMKNTVWACKVLLANSILKSVNETSNQGKNKQLQYQIRDKDPSETRQTNKDPSKIMGVSCSCGQLCKNLRGLKLHQIKAKCQASENKLTGPDKRCFVSLTDILNTSFLKFGDIIYCKTPSNTFVPICNFDKPISAAQCFVKTNDIVIDPISEYFNDNISPCDSNACLTCNSFISDQSFKSNLTGRIYKTQTYGQLTCGSSSVVYAIHCIRCGLMYVGDTGRSLRSRINLHRAGIIKDGQNLLYNYFRLPRHSVADIKVQILETFYHSSENPVNIRLHQRLQELHWIKELGTAALYGCNDQINELVP